MKTYMLTALKLSLGKSGSCIIRVDGSSMKPFICSGDQIKIEKVKIDNIAVGDIIAIESEDILIVHRVIKINKLNEFTKEFIICGDSSPGSTACVAENKVVGRVKMISHKGSPFKLPRKQSALIIGPFLRFIFKSKQHLIFNFKLCFVFLLSLLLFCANQNFKSLKSDSKSSDSIISSEDKILPDTLQKYSNREEKILPGDEIDLLLYEQLPVSNTPRYEKKRVNQDGEILIVPLGIIKIGGKTTSEACKEIEQKMSEFVQSPFCEMTITKRSYQKQIFILGEISNPGILELKEGDRLLTAIMRAGGCKGDNFNRTIKIIRLSNVSIKIITIDLGAVVYKGKMDANILLTDQDVIVIPKKLVTTVKEVLDLVGTIVPWYYFIRNFEF